MSTQPTPSQSDTGVPSHTALIAMADTGSMQHRRLARTGPASLTPCRYSRYAKNVPMTTSAARAAIAPGSSTISYVHGRTTAAATKPPNSIASPVTESDPHFLRTCSGSSV